MKRTLMITLTAAALSASLVACGTMEGAGPAAQAKAPQQKLLLQVSDEDPKTWNQTLNVAGNIKRAYGKDGIDVEIVAFGRGIGMLKFDSPVNNRINDAVKAGVKIVACENSMKRFKLQRADMNDSISYVPAGIKEIIERQAEGYAYVRP